MSALRVALLLAVPACGSLEYYDTEVDGKSDGSLDGGSTPAGDADGDADADSDADSDTDPLDTETTPPGTTTTTTPPGTTTTTTPPGTTTTTTTTTVPPPPIALDAVTPDFGPNAGGTVVTATGTFDASTTLEFGGVPGSVLSSTATTLTVQTPSTAANGWVDVRAVSGAQSDTIPSGYQYWADGTGNSGTFGWMTFVRIVGGYWGPGTVDVASGLFAFTQPAGWEIWQDYAPVMGTCQFNYASAAPPAFYDPGAAYVSLTSGGATVRLDAVGGTPGAFTSQNPLVPSVDVVPGAVYDLDPVAGGPDWPGFGITGAVEMPNPFTVSLPDMARPNPPDVFESFTLNWGGPAGDYALIYMLRQYQDLFGGWVNDGVVTCAVPDTGAFTIPNGVWPNWFNNDFLHVQVGRAIESTVVLPNNNAENRMVGIYWYYGGTNTQR